MFTPSRKFLLIFLTLLQLVTPLVHAHAHILPFTTGKLHVPGLEIYTQEHEAVLSASDNYDGADGVIVGVDAGIQSLHSKIFAGGDADTPYYLPAQFFSFATAPPARTQYALFLTLTLVQPWLDNCHCPRAPPAH